MRGAEMHAVGVWLTSSQERRSRTMGADSIKEFASLAELIHEGMEVR